MSDDYGNTHSTGHKSKSNSNTNIYISAKDIAATNSNSRSKLNKSKGDDKCKRPFEHPVVVGKKRNYTVLKNKKSDH